VIEAGRVVLTRREDLGIWCLPGGGVDAGESVAHAAIREVREETGLDVRLTVFAAERIAGTLCGQVGEVGEIDFFATDALPGQLLWWHRLYIRDVLDGRCGSVARTIDAVWPFDRDIPHTRLRTMRERGECASEIASLCTSPVTYSQRIDVGEEK